MSGKIACSSDFLKITETGTTSEFAQLFTKTGGRPSGPGPLLGLTLEKTLRMSSSARVGRGIEMLKVGAPSKWQSGYTVEFVLYTDLKKSAKKTG